MKCIALLFSLSVVLFTHAQVNTEVGIIYLDKNWEETQSISSAVYYRKITLEGNGFRVRDYYKSNDSIQMDAFCKSITPHLAYEGEVKWFYDNGVIGHEMYFKKRTPASYERFYYQDKTPQTLILHKDTDKGKEFYCQHWNSAGIPLLINGTGVISTNVTEKGQNYLEVKDSLVVASYVVRKNDTVHFAPEKRAEYKGGSDKMHEYIQKIMKYPKQARKSKTQGNVYVEFIVNEKGIVEEIRILTGIGAGCDEEAVRCVAAMPPWNPAIWKNAPVKSMVFMPVSFWLKQQ